MRSGLTYFPSRRLDDLRGRAHEVSGVERGVHHVAPVALAAPAAHAVRHAQRPAAVAPVRQEVGVLTAAFGLCTQNKGEAVGHFSERRPMGRV